MTERAERMRKVSLAAACNKSYYKLKLTWKDILAIVLMVIVYSCIAFINLGSTVMPQTYWTTSKMHEYFIVDLGEEVHVSRINYFCGIAESGKMNIFYYDAENDKYELMYKNVLDGNGEVTDKKSLGDVDPQVFKIVSMDHDYAPDMKTRYLKFSTVRSGLELGEIGIFVGDSKTALTGVKVIETNIPAEKGDPAVLFDEPEAIPYSYDFMNSTYFDEVYHGRTGYEHLNGIRPYEWTHPPLGKLLIAGGMALFGTNMFGMRAMGTIFGVLLLPLMYIFGKKVTKDSLGGFAAAFLMMFDFMHFTHSRISSIDVYGVTFVLLMFYFMYDFCVSRPQNLGLKRSFATLALSGFFMGCAISVKWNMAYGALGLAVVFALTVFEQMWHKHLIEKAGLCDEYPWTKDFLTDNILKTGVFCVLVFIVVPVTLYFATFIPYTTVTEGTAYRFKDVLNLQLSIFKYHSSDVLDATHDFQSAWYTWPVIGKPLWMYSAYGEDGMRGTITTMGNPAIWWVGIGAVIMSAIIAIQKRDRRIVPIFIAIASLYLPWVFVERCTFIYHFFPIVPFMILCIAYVLVYIKKNVRKWKWIVGVYFAVVVALFVMFYPVLTGIQVESGYISKYLLWFFNAWYF